MIIPKQIIIEPTSRCNLKCKYCPVLTADKAIDMDLDYFKSIIDRIVFKTTVIPWMNGEPLLHPHYYEMIKYITDKDIPCYVQTNGTICNEELFHHVLMDNSCYQICFSLDGMWNTGSINIARPGSDEKAIKTNINKLLEAKKSFNSNTDIAIKICERGQDYGEIEAFVKYWLEKGMDFVVVGKALTQINEKSMRTSPCQYPDNNFMVIRADGTVVFCAYHLKMVNDKNFAVGKLDAKSSLLKFYNGPAYQLFRIHQHKGIYHKVCRTCGFAYTGLGFNGEVKFRGEGKQVYFHQDYYNQFFSYKKKWKTDEYYE